MGSKASMLDQGLQSVLDRELVSRKRFVDLFAGSGVVARRVALKHAVPVVAIDTQRYSRHLAAAVIERTRPIDNERLLEWIGSARDLDTASVHGTSSSVSLSAVLDERSRAQEVDERNFVTRAYGGHYFSVAQAMAIDALLQSMEGSAVQPSFLMAAILEAASSAAAAPGHTAQPFQPTEALLPHISAAWSRDIYSLVEAFGRRNSRSFARVEGAAVTADADSFAHELDSSDLVFCDPPYSEVQYSRFYHVLEGIAVGGWETVEGTGRAPALGLRYRSDFSSRKSSTGAFEKLFRTMSARGATVVLTFPNHDCSNGQSAESIARIARTWFSVRTHLVTVSHSSLGGASAEKSKSLRQARRAVEESVLILKPE